MTEREKCGKILSNDTLFGRKNVMLLFYIRHGDPIYSPDSLTPLGERQAEALAKRLAIYGIDRIYASPSNRAILTAKPTCEILQKELKDEIVTLDFCDEGKAYPELSALLENDKRCWAFVHPEYVRHFTSREVTEMTDHWYDHPLFAGTRFKEGTLRIEKGCDEFIKSLGYRHDRENKRYYIEKHNDERIALFAHQGFGLSFLSALLDIPYPVFATHFDLSTSGMTVIEFREFGDIALPRVLTLSNDSHLYREGLPTNYNHRVKF